MKVESKSTVPLTNQSSGTYVCVLPDAQSKITLGKIAFALGLPLHDDDFEDLHSTVIYSKDRFPSNTKIPHDRQFSAFVKDVQFWDGHDGDGYVVLVLDSPDLVALHQEWKDRGLIHSFDDYTPHVTLKSKLANSVRLEQKINTVKPKVAGLKLKFGQETVEGLKPSKTESTTKGLPMAKLEAKSRLILSAYSDFEEAQALAVTIFAESPLKFKPLEIRRGESYPTLGLVTFSNGNQMQLSYAGADKKVIKYSLNIGVGRSNELYRTESLWPAHNKLMAARAKELKKVRGFKTAVVPTDKYLSSFNLVAKRGAVVSPDGSPPVTKSGKYAVKITAPGGRSTVVDWSTNIGKGPWPYEVAEGALQDVQEQYSYDDDWKRATFSLVKVSN